MLNNPSNILDDLTRSTDRLFSNALQLRHHLDGLLDDARSNDNGRLADGYYLLPGNVDIVNHLGDADSQGIVGMVVVQVGFDGLEVADGV